MTITTLLRFNLHYYRRHALLSLLCLAGICLGVGIVVAVELINDSALSSFGASVDYLSGKATHSVVSGYGRIDEQQFRRIWPHPGVKAASPVVEVMASCLETGQEPIRFLGIDPFLDADFRSLSSAAGDDSSLFAFLAGQPPGIFLSGRLRKRYGLKADDRLTILTAGIEKTVRILGDLPESVEAGTGENLALMDISAAQDIFGRVGYLDRIDIISAGDDQAIKQSLPEGLRLTDADSKKSTLQAMLYSFQLNLTAMSLLALFVGVFLIYNFSMFSVLSRREDMSLLLTLGADRRSLVAAFLAESLLLGAAGSLLGVLFGYFVALFSIERVSSAISDIYFHVSVQTVRLTLLVALKGAGVGFLATFAGIGLPALEVAVTPPILGLQRQSIEDRAQRLKNWLFAGGVVFFGVAVVSGWASRFSIFWGFASAFGMTLAFALFTPGGLSLFTRHVGRWLKVYFGSLEGFLAARNISASLSRTSIAVAALAVALSMTIGVDTMIHSFRSSVDAWLGGSLHGDLYISPATTRWDHPLPEELVTQLGKDPRIEAVERYSTHEVYLGERPVRLRVIDAAVLKNYSGFTFLRGGKGAWQALENGGVFISESLSYHSGFTKGDMLELESPQGRRFFPVVAVTRDYSSDRGSVHIDRVVYEGIWKDARVQSVALFLKPGVSPEEVRNSVVSDFPGLERTIVSNKGMRENALAIFDKTFAPTATLKGVSLLVALLGVATALMAILMERSREMTVLGYLGLTPGELGKMNIYQALVMGMASFLTALVCGLVLTYIIIFAINYRSFGWSIDIYLNPHVFLKSFFLTMLSCLTASLYPTYKLMRSPRQANLADE